MEFPQIKEEETKREAEKHEARNQVLFHMDLADRLSKEAKDYVKAWKALDQALMFADSGHVRKEFEKDILERMQEVNKHISAEDIDREETIENDAGIV